MSTRIDAANPRISTQHRRAILATRTEERASRPCPSYMLAIRGTNLAFKTRGVWGVWAYCMWVFHRTAHLACETANLFHSRIKCSGVLEQDLIFDSTKRPSRDFQPLSELPNPDPEALPLKEARSPHPNPSK